eukprot:Seg1501.7 transcript_id=Seg1501.7/GoldUCD/mRNA.D3Y31 product="Netrin receptor UNC5C" protein_id=Seg1501.7/GoldUCD/D3Y31
MAFHTLRVCSSTLLCQAASVVVVQIGNGVNESKAMLMICPQCVPGFESSNSCRIAIKKGLHQTIGQEKANKLLKNHTARFSICTSCVLGRFSDGYGFAKRCKPCTRCNADKYPVVVPCTFKTDTQCSERSVNSTRTTEIPRASLKHLKSSYTVPVIIVSVAVLFMVSAFLLRKNWSRRVNNRHFTDYLVPVPMVDVGEIDLQCREKYLVDKYGSLTQESNHQHPGLDKKILSNHLSVSPLNSVDSGYSGTITNAHKQRRPTLANFIERMGMDSCGATSCNDEYFVGRSCSDSSRETGYYSGRSGVASNDDISSYSADELHTSVMFGYDGGSFHVPNTSVRVLVPEGAVLDGQRKEVSVTVHLSRPNDWKELRHNGQTIDLPQVQLGPTGSQFLKPIEVVIENSRNDVPEDIEYEFADGDTFETAVWKKAIRENSREKAQSSAMLKEPHVSYYVGKRNTHAFYMHFTFGRKKRLRNKSKWLAVTAVIKGNTLGVIFYEPTNEGSVLLQRRMANSIEVVQFQKEINVKKCDGNIQIVMKNLKGNWMVAQGAETQEISIKDIFSPEFIGHLPVVDYILEGTTAAAYDDLSCQIDIMQLGQASPGKTDLKVDIRQETWMTTVPRREKSFEGGKTNRSSFSSGYASKTSLMEPVRSKSPEKSPVKQTYKLDDHDYRKEKGLKYLHRMCNDLADLAAPYCADFARLVQLSFIYFATVRARGDNS